MMSFDVPTIEATGIGTGTCVNMPIAARGSVRDAAIWSRSGAPGNREIVRSGEAAMPPTILPESGREPEITATAPPTGEVGGTPATMRNGHVMSDCGLWEIMAGKAIVGRIVAIVMTGAGMMNREIGIRMAAD
jgi:hypothetical protein